MHWLDRASHLAPPCLAGYQARHTWEDVSTVDRIALRSALRAMTMERCAYCERLLLSPARQALCHIEHFRRRALYPNLTFVWSNLFISCEDNDSCGKHKDQSKEVRTRPFNPADIIKPDAEDPERLLFFTVDGDVRPRRGLSEQDEHRANETIRVFNLNNTVLRQRRRTAVQRYRNTDPDFIDLLALFPQQEQVQILRDEIAKTTRDEFATTLRHLLLPP